MTVIPLSVFIFVVIVLLGGPVSFMNIVTLWVSDMASYVGTWIRHL